jgi:hypothetical protein
VLAAGATTLALIAMYCLSIGSNAAHGLDAPVRRDVVRIVERVLVRLDNGEHVHPFVPKVLAVMFVNERRSRFRMIHDVP